MSWWSAWSEAALALVYPERCAACDADCDQGAAFCALCADTLEPITFAAGVGAGGGGACERCGLPGARRCLACLARAPPYTSARAPFQFGGALARAIRRMKWGNQPELARQLGRLLTGSFAPDGDVIVPVPLHPKRLRAREFNQAALLALESRRATGPPSRRATGPPVRVDALERVRDTPPQSALGLVERRANVAGAFSARAERVRGCVVTLVDDVLTTGATAEACARALRDAGAVEVRVLTVARAVP
jgi:ComF family protein